MTAGPVDAVVLAAGGATRMGGEDKLLAPLADAPLIVWSLRAFEQTPEIRQVVVTASAANRDQIADVIRAARLTKVTRVVLGGASRAESVLHGLETLVVGGAAFAVIHDGARPFVTPDIIARGVQAARAHGAAVAAVPSVDTVKLVTPAGRVGARCRASRCGWPRPPKSVAWTPCSGPTGATATAWRRSPTTWRCWSTRACPCTCSSPTPATSRSRGPPTCARRRPASRRPCPAILTR